MSQVLQPKGWPRPRGYSNGVLARGSAVFLAGQIGWNSDGEFARGLAAQVEQALRNIVAVLAEAGGRPEHLVRLTWFVVSRSEYLAELGAIGTAYRAVLGRHFPAMSVVEVSALIEPQARVEIEATAVLPEF